MSPLRRLLLAALLLIPSAPVAAATPTPAECSGGPGPFRCLYRSLLPSSGIIADCHSDRDCRVGYYYGRPDQATWFTPPADLSTLPKPEVLWHTATFAETRLPCGRACARRQIFSARDISRIERDWTPGLTVGEAITAIHFDPDGRLSLTWLKGPERAAVSERVTVPTYVRQ